MQKYIKDRYKSRGKRYGDRCRCEREGCNLLGTEKHHILCSYRAKRKNSDDGKDIINLCRFHHEYIHNHNTFDNRQVLLDRVAFILETIQNERKGTLGM